MYMILSLRGNLKFCARGIFFMLANVNFSAKALLHFITLLPFHVDRGSTVVKALCYKSEGRCFDPRWCHWNFSLT